MLNRLWCRRFQRGFTLIEALVVLAVFSVILAVLLPAIVRAREEARKSSCKGRLKQLGLAMHNYHGLYQMFPAGWIGVAGGQPQLWGLNGFGWGAALLPFIDESELYNQINFKRHFTDAVNEPFRQAIPEWRSEWPRCPSDHRSARWTTISQGRALVMPGSSYAPVFGTDGPDRCLSQPNQQCKGDGLFFQNSFMRFKDIRDGTSNTLMLGERRPPNAELPTWFSTWTGVVPDDKQTLTRLLGSGAQLPGDPAGTVADFRGFHSGGVLFLLADSNVRMLGDQITARTYRAVLTPNSLATEWDCGF